MSDHQNEYAELLEQLCEYGKYDPLDTKAAAAIRALQARNSELRATLIGIADASPKNWEMSREDFLQEFLPWARNRARDAIRPTESGKGE